MINKLVIAVQGDRGSFSERAAKQSSINLQLVEYMRLFLVEL